MISYEEVVELFSRKTLYLPSKRELMFVFDILSSNHIVASEEDT